MMSTSTTTHTYVQSSVKIQTRWPRRATAYEEYMEQEGPPVHRNIPGVTDLVCDLAFGRWDRLGCEGAFVELDGFGGVHGLAVIRVAPGTQTIPERHLFEEQALVLRGMGLVRLSDPSTSAASSVACGPYSLIAIPPGATHAFENIGDEPLYVLFSSNAPVVFDVFRDPGFILGAGWEGTLRRDVIDGWFLTSGYVGLEDDTNRGFYSGSILPDVNGCHLPADGQRGPGYRHMEYVIGGGRLRGFIGEYPAGNRGLAHAHASGPALVCLSGRGYCLSWPRDCGPTPWRDGHTDQVVRIDYRAGGIVNPVPGPGEWFHAHYGASRDPLRVLALTGVYPTRVTGSPGDIEVDTNAPLAEGGTTIMRHDEDPEVEAIFERAQSEA